MFLEEIEIVEDLYGPHIIPNSKLITKYMVTIDLEKPNESMEKQFDDISDFTAEEIRKCLVGLINILSLKLQSVQ